MIPINFEALEGGPGKPRASGDDPSVTHPSKLTVM